MAWTHTPSITAGLLPSTAKRFALPSLSFVTHPDLSQARFRSTRKTLDAIEPSLPSPRSRLRPLPSCIGTGSPQVPCFCTQSPIQQCCNLQPRPKVRQRDLLCLSRPGKCNSSHRLAPFSRWPLPGIREYTLPPSSFTELLLQPYLCCCPILGGLSGQPHSRVK